METVNVPNPKHNHTGRALGGLVIIAVGVIWLLKKMSFFVSPPWLFSWPMLLIVLGFYIGARHRFRGWGGSFIMMVIGGYFLVKDYFYHYEIVDYLWPIAIIASGLYMIFRPKRYWDWDSTINSHHARHHMRHHHHWKKWEEWQAATGNIPPSGEDFIDATSIFSGVHKVIISKNFKGGDVVNIFGGADINLTQADFTGTVILELTQIFGGTKIVVPTDWKIITKMTSVFGGVEDKRPPALIKENPDKTLIIEGTSIFAGVSIQCY